LIGSAYPEIAMAARKREADVVSELSPERQSKIRQSLPEDAPDLGEITAAHTLQNLPPPWVWYLGAVLLVIFAGFLLGLALNNRPADPNTMPMMIIAGVIAALGVGLAVTGAVLTFNPRATSPDVYVFCTGGLIHARAGAVDALPWADLKIRKTCANPLNRRYELTGHDGEPLIVKVPPIGGNKFVKPLHDGQFRHAFPELLAAVNSGGEVRFGRFGVSTRGLAYRKTPVPWESIKALNFSYDQRKTQQLFLEVAVRGASDITVNASEELPNIWMFMELVSKVHPPLKKFKDSQSSWLM
jgi:hypothetical protein